MHVEFTTQVAAYIIAVTPRIAVTCCTDFNIGFSRYYMFLENSFPTACALCMFLNRSGWLYIYFFAAIQLQHFMLLYAAPGCL